MRRPGSLAFLAVRGGVATARFHADRQTDFVDRRQQVALDIMCKRLERRNIQCVQPLRCLSPAKPRRRKIGKRRQEPRQRLAGPGIRYEQSVPTGIARYQHIRLVLPDAPATPCEPVLQLGRNGGLHHG